VFYFVLLCTTLIRGEMKLSPLPPPGLMANDDSSGVFRFALFYLSIILFRNTAYFFFFFLAYSVLSVA
jgi:hypothetical protein